MSVDLDKLGKLLAKADNEAGTQEERDAFMEAAEKFAALLGVDLAVARALHANKEKQEELTKRSFKVGNYSSKKNAYLVKLFLAIAHPHDIRCTISQSNIYVWGYGFPTDLDVAEALFGILVVQMVGDADKALKAGAQKTAVERWDRTQSAYRPAAVDGRVYRANFYEGFISRLSSRLWAARRDAIKVRGEASEAAQTGVEVALRDKSKDVDDYYEEHTHRTRGTWDEPESSGYVREALDRGAASAQNASLDLSGKVVSGRKGELR